MRRGVRWLLVIIVVVAAGLVLWSNRFGEPEDFSDMESQYKYGSIGSDHPLTRGMPYWIWKVLPIMFPPAEMMPKGFELDKAKRGYDAFGLVTEADRERPIGFSRRTVFGLDFVGLNCAFCHVSTLRRTPQDQAPQVILGGVGNAVDIEKYFLYTFAAVLSPEFTGDRVMEQVRKQNPDMGLLERLVYRYVLVPVVRHYVGQLREQFDFIDTRNPARLPQFGPGRVDTWAAYKRVYMQPPLRDSIPGIVDFPSVWNQKARTGMRIHWDGNTDVLEERNIISALGVVGKNIGYLDFPRLTRVGAFIPWLLPPRYDDRTPQPIDRKLVEAGTVLFQRECAVCHAPDGIRVGRVEPIQDLGTDPERIKDFGPPLADALDRLGTDAWKLRSFQAQAGYANALLDGIWLRSPYLHNGSVPTLRDLLNKPEQRPKKFCRGTDLYDWKNVGYVSAMDPGNGAEPCGVHYLFDTSVPGNSNAGHLYGTGLQEKEKDALLEFLKTL